MAPREIEFRAWDDHNKVMKFYTLKQLADEDKFNYDTEFEAIQSGFDNWKWMQYTGLKDKNKIKIYEGDIIRRSTGYVFEVMLREYRLGEINQAKAFGHDWHESDEVIGNVFETPELISKQLT